MPLSIRDIEYFLAVARTGLLSTAADELGVSQSALTKAVQRVESEFDLPLFERSARGMALTSAGLRMVEQAHRLQADYADLVLLANEMRAQQSGLLRVGVTDTTAGNRVALALGSLLAQRPGLRVRLRVDRSDALAALLHEGVLDLALVPVYEGQRLDADRTKIDNDPMLPLVRARHPLLQCARVGLADVAAYGWITSPANAALSVTITQIFARHQLPAPRVVMEVPFVSDLNLSVLAATDLVMMVPRSFMRHVEGQQFGVLPITELRVPRAVVLLSRPGSGWSPLMQTLRDNLLALGRKQGRLVGP